MISVWKSLPLLEFRENKLAVNVMKKLLIIVVLLLVSIFSLACGEKNRDEGFIQSMFPLVPAEMASGNILVFSDIGKIKELSGIDPGSDMPVAWTSEEEFQVIENTVAGWYQSEFSGAQYLEYWPDSFGYSALYADQEVWAFQAVEKGIRPLFSIMEGEFDEEAVDGKLDNLGYALKSYASYDYYSINDDYQTGDIGSSMEARMARSHLNRMMVAANEIIAAPANSILFSLLDVRSAETSSIEDSPAYNDVAEALGDVLGAALIPQSQLISDNVADDWENLHYYDLAGIGYSFQEDEQKIVIVIHYPDDSANDDMQELDRRLSDYMTTLGGQNPLPLTDFFEVGESSATSYGPRSVLTIELVYKPDTPRSSWQPMIYMRDLGFLVVSPSG